MNTNESLRCKCRCREINDLLLDMFVISWKETNIYDHFVIQTVKNTGSVPYGIKLMEGNLAYQVLSKSNFILFILVDTGC